MIKSFAWIFYCCFYLYSMPSAAQSVKIDSIVTLLRQSNKPNGLDTVLLKSAITRLNKAVIKDADISRLETEANRLVKGDNEDASLFMKYYIYQIIPDVNKKIDYYKLLIEKVNNSKS